MEDSGNRAEGLVLEDFENAFINVLRNVSKNAISG